MGSPRFGVTAPQRPELMETFERWNKKITKLLLSTLPLWREQLTPLLTRTSPVTKEPSAETSNHYHHDRMTQSICLCIPPARIILCLSPHKPLLVHHLPFLDPRPSWSPGEPRPHRTPRTARHQGRRGDDRSQRQSGASTVAGVGKRWEYRPSSSACTNVQGNLPVAEEGEWEGGQGNHSREEPRSPKEGEDDGGEDPPIRKRSRDTTQPAAAKGNQGEVGQVTQQQCIIVGLIGWCGESESSDDLGNKFEGFYEYKTVVGDGSGPSSTSSSSSSSSTWASSGGARKPPTTSDINTRASMNTKALSSHSKHGLTRFSLISLFLRPPKFPASNFQSLKMDFAKFVFITFTVIITITVHVCENCTFIIQNNGNLH